MHWTWKTRFGVTAAFVGGFWLLGQATAQADENDATGTLESVTSVVSGTTAGAPGNTGSYQSSGDTEAIAISEADGGDGGDAESDQQADHNGGNTALLTGNNVNVGGNACLLANCETRQDVDNDSHNATTDIDQTAVNVGGDGGNATSTSTAGTKEPSHQESRYSPSTRSSGSNSSGDTEAIAISEADGGDGGDAESDQQADHNGGNTALLTGNNVNVGGNACLLANCETRQDVDNDSHNATTDIDQTAVNVGGDGGNATSTATAGTKEPSHQESRYSPSTRSSGSNSSGDTEAIAISEADGGDGGDAESDQQADHNGGNTALLTGNNVNVGGNACLLANCETRQDVDNDSHNATTDIDQTAVNVGGDGGNATSTSTAGTKEPSHQESRYSPSTRSSGSNSSGDTEAIAISEADGGNGGDAESDQQADHNGGNTALLTGNNVNVGGNACLLANCETRQDVDNDSHNATTDIDQTAVNVGGDGGNATSTATSQQREREPRGECKKESRNNWKRSTW